MNKPRILVKLLCFTILVTLWAGAELSHAGQFRNWRNLRVADLPARVRAIKWRSGFILDEGHAVGWGAWTVKFGSELPVATMGTSNTPRRPVGVTELLCSNQVIGEKKCSFFLLRDYEGAVCSIFIYTDPLTQINIKCPQGIDLE